MVRKAPGYGANPPFLTRLVRDNPRTSLSDQNQGIMSLDFDGFFSDSVLRPLSLGSAVHKELEMGV